MYSSITHYYTDQNEKTTSDYFGFFRNGTNLSDVKYVERDYGPYVPPSQDTLFEGSVPEIIDEHREDYHFTLHPLIHPAAYLYEGIKYFNYPDFVKSMKELIKGHVLKIYGIVFTDISSPITSTICYATNSKWSHVGLLLRDENLNKYLFESNGSATDVLRGIYPCVQISKINQTKIHYRLFNGMSPPYPDLNEFVKNHLGVPYKDEKLDLIRSVNRSNTSFNPNSFFCSELVAFTLNAFGILSKSVLPNNYYPGDFDNDNPQMMLNRGITLGSISYN